MKKNCSKMLVTLAMGFLLITVFLLTTCPNASLIAATEEKSLEELEKELADKKNELNSTGAQGSTDPQTDTLYNALTSADAQKEIARGIKPIPNNENLSSFLSPSGWIPLAACTITGLLMFIGVLKLMRKIIFGRVKDDFIK